MVSKKMLLRQNTVNHKNDLTNTIVTIGYYALIEIKDCKINCSRISIYKRWKHAGEAGDLIFGHNQMLDLAFYQFSKSVRESPILFSLLTERFTLNQLSKLTSKFSGWKSMKCYYAWAPDCIKKMVNIIFIIRQIRITLV